MITFRRLFAYAAGLGAVVGGLVGWFTYPERDQER